MPLKQRSVLWNLKGALGEDVSSWLMPTKPRMRSDGIKGDVQLEQIEAGLVASSSRHNDHGGESSDDPGEVRGVGMEVDRSLSEEQEQLLVDMHIRLDRIDPRSQDPFKFVRAADRA